MEKGFELKIDPPIDDPSEGFASPEATPYRGFSAPDKDLVDAAHVRSVLPVVTGGALGTVIATAHLSERLPLIVESGLLSSIAGGTLIGSGALLTAAYLRKFDNALSGHKQFEKRIGEIVEVYRHDTKGMMRWNLHPTDTTDLGERLRRIAQIAVETDCQNLAIGMDIVAKLPQDALDQIAEQVPSSVENIADRTPYSWAESVNALKAGAWNSYMMRVKTDEGAQTAFPRHLEAKPDDPEADKVIFLYARDMAFHPQEVEVQRPVPQTPLETYVDKLHTIRPNNIVSKTFAEFADVPTLRAEKAIKAVTTLLNEELYEAVQEPNTALIEAHHLSTTDTYFAEIQKRASFTTDDLRRTKHQARKGRVMTDPDSLMRRSEDKGVDVLWQQGTIAKRQDLLEALGFTDQEVITHLLDKPEDMPKDAWRILLAKTCAELLHTDHTEEYEGEKRSMITKEIRYRRTDELVTRRKYGGQRRHTDGLSFDIRKRRTQQISHIAAIGALTAGVLIGAVEGAAYLHNGGSAQQNPRDSLVDIGNISGNAKNRPEWLLEPHGISTDGYWGQTAETGFSDGQWFDYSEVDLRSREPVVMTPKKVDETIKVSLGETTPIFREVNADNIGKGLVIPVKEGTRVAAASVNDRPVAVGRLADGSTALFSDKTTLFPANASDVTEITYWLTPDVESGQLRSIGDYSYNTDEFSKIQTAWKQATPETGSDMIARANYIWKNFEYDLEPLDNTADAHKESRLVKESLRKKEAVCNTAASILALSNPEEAAYASGYRESKTNATELSTRELHAWNVTMDGIRIDATPPDRDGNAQGFFQESVYEETTMSGNDILQSPITQTAAGLLGAYVIGLGVYRRRDIYQGAKSLARGIKRAAVQPERRKRTALKAIEAHRTVVEQAIFAEPANTGVKDTLKTDRTPDQTVTRMPFEKASYLYDPQALASVRQLEAATKIHPARATKRQRKAVRQLFRTVTRALETVQKYSD